MGLFIPIVAAAAGIVLYESYKKKTTAASNWPLTQGHAYSISLSYNGAGVGGNPDQNTVQNLINANGLTGLDVTNAPTTDPTNKVITFLAVAASPVTVSAAQLSAGWSPAYGTVSVISVQDVGGAPVPATA